MEKDSEEKKLFIPKTLEECYKFLDIFLQDKDVFIACPEEDVLGIAHMGLGRWLRNNWYLWWSTELYERIKANKPDTDYPTTKPELVEYFNILGIEHADDMSAIVIISYHKKLNNKTYDMDADIKEIKEFYIQQEAENNSIKKNTTNENSNDIDPK